MRIEKQLRATRQMLRALSRQKMLDALQRLFAEKRLCALQIFCGRRRRSGRERNK